MYPILSDEDVARLLPFAKAVQAIEQALLAKAQGQMVSPPRFAVSTGGGSLVFTAGAETAFSHTLGVRLYDTFVDRSPGHAQLVAVFDSQTGVFKGLVIGDLIGGMRTAAINAVAIRHMARKDAHRLGILGAGFQARLHLQAALAVHPFERIQVYSPTAAKQEAFAREMAAETGIAVEAAATAEEVVQNAEVLICATNSSTPVFEAGWLRPGVHVNTIGPKFKHAHELPVEAAVKSRVIASDSLEQVDAYPRPFFLSGTPERQRMAALDQIVSGQRPGRFSPEDITLFCSVGLSGTEVVLANAVLEAQK